MDSSRASSVRAVENDEFYVGLGAGFEKVAGERLEGPEAGAGVLKVDDDGVELFEIGEFRVLIGGFGAVELNDGDVGRGVDFSAVCKA